MIFPFNKGEFLFIKDIERCPFMFKDYQYSSWWKDDDYRQLLIALDRYAKSLICNHTLIDVDGYYGIAQQCTKCERLVYMSWK